MSSSMQQTRGRGTRVAAAETAGLPGNACSQQAAQQTSWDRHGGNFRKRSQVAVLAGRGTSLTWPGFTPLAASRSSRSLARKACEDHSIQIVLNAEV